MDIKKLLTVTLLGWVIVFLVSGCGFVRAKQNLEESSANYKECLKANPTDTSKCAGLKEIYEVDRNAYDSMTNTNQEIVVKDKD